MESKILTLTGLSILSLVLMINFIAAATVVSDNFNDGDLNGWTVTGWSNSGTFANSSDTTDASLMISVPTTGFENIVVSYDRQLGVDWETSDLFKVTWTIDGTNYNTLEEVSGNSVDALPDDTGFVSKTFNAPASVDNNANFEIKIECSTSAMDEFCNLDNVLVEGTEIVTSSDDPEEVTECNLVGNVGGDLRVKSIDFNNEGMNGVTRKEFGDDDEWFPLDDIEVEIEIENNGDDDIDDIELEWGLWDTSADEWVIDLDEEKDFNLKDDDEETLTFSFNLEDKLDVDLEDLKDGDNYRFYVIANGEVDDDDNTPTCESDFEQVGIVIEDDFVILSGFEFSETATCDSIYEINADVWNIGDNDQEDVFVRVVSSELGIKETVDIGDVDAFDKEDFNVAVDIPADLDEKSYSITFQIFDEDNDLFETDFDDDEAIFDLVFQVSGGCGAEAADALVSASLESGGNAGEELVVRATIVNTGEDSATYDLNPQGFGSWADSADVEPSTLLLDKGEARDVLITLNVKDDAEGENSFNIEIVSDNELVLSQPVSVSIEPKSGFSGLTGGVIGSSNAYLWGIGFLNIILVIIIIIVAIRVARK